MNTVKSGTVTWRPQPWQDADSGGGEPLSDSDSEEEDFPDDTTTPLGEYVTEGETPYSRMLLRPWPWRLTVLSLYNMLLSWASTPLEGFPLHVGVVAVGISEHSDKRALVRSD